MWRLGLYVTVWTAADLEDVSSETPFFHLPAVVAGPPPPNLLALAAGPREPLRGSRDGLNLARRSPFGGHYGVEMAREVANLVFGLLWQPT